MYSLHKKREVGLTCLSKARNYVKLKNWVRAFPHFLMCLELFENEQSKFELEFTEVLYELGLWLEANNKFTDICKWYVKGLEYFPTNANILNNFAEQLLRIEEPQTALLYLESAYASNPDLLIIEKNITTAKLNILPRWHFRMLNDARRNGAYKTAIASTITVEFNKVLDIGTGCGLLSFYASLFGAKSVVAVETSSALCSIAEKALGDSVNIINKHSTTLTQDEIALSNLLITEIFDAGFFGEHVLEILIHAWNNLLLSSSKIIPNSADLFITGFNSRDMSLSHKLKSFPHLDLVDTCVTQRMNEPYEAENLKLKSVTYLTDTYKACTVYLNNVDQLKNIYENINAVPPFTLTCSKSGRIDAFAIWYNLYMDEARTIMITTNPQMDSVTCWEQAVIYLDHSINLQEGDVIELQISCVCNELKVHIIKPIISCTHCFKVSPEIITFLNDAQIENVSTNFVLPQDFPMQNLQVLDLNPFPIFAFTLAKKGYEGTFRCVLSDPRDFEFFNFFCHCNNVNINLFEIHSDEKLDELTMEFDLIFVNPVLKNGTLCEKTFRLISGFRNRLKEHGFILPKGLQLHLNVIESDYLDHCYKVNDENLLGFTVAEEINKYAVLEHWEIEAKFFSHRVLGEAIRLEMDLFHADLQNNKEIDVKISSGTAHGVIYWFTMDFSPTLVSTLRSTHYNNACFIFQTFPNSNVESDIKLKIKHNTGLLKITSEV
ncbi:hypothetical protein FQR65_LT07516 [Abscondita terminalis]|nr:hypothetical protein FQR65_LT07516 [Abscondita terminalis]